MLLAGASLLIASFVRLSRQPTGFIPDRLWVAFIGLPPGQYPDPAAKARFAERLQAELKNSPGIESAALGDGVPLGGGRSSSPYARVDGNPVPVNQRPLGLTRSVSPGFIKTFGIPLLAGRDFDERDAFDKPLVVIVSKSTAQKLFPGGEDPIGKRILFGTDNNTGLPAEVVGIVGDVRSIRLDQANDIEFYRPWPQRSWPRRAPRRCSCSCCRPQPARLPSGPTASTAAARTTFSRSTTRCRAVTTPPSSTRACTSCCSPRAGCFAPTTRRS